MNIDLNYRQMGERIKKFRLQAHLTQEQLANEVDMATSNISHIERATTQVSLPSLVKIANTLNVSLDQLVCDSLPVADVYLEKDIADLMKDCTTEEKRIIRDILTVTKKTLKEHKK